MKKVLSLLLLGSLFSIKAQSGTVVTLDKEFNTSGISNSAPSYQPVKEVPSQSKQSMYPDWVNKIKEPAISEDIRPEIRETFRQIKTKPTIKESDKVQEVIDEMFPNKIPASYDAPTYQTVKPAEQKQPISVYEYQNSKKQSNALLNVFLPLVIVFCMILFFVWMVLKDKTASIQKEKETHPSYSQREQKLKETLIESAKQALVLDLREMEIRGILDDRDITIQTLLRTYQEISLDQIGEYSKSANISKIEVEKIIKTTYQILQVQYYKS